MRKYKVALLQLRYAQQIRDRAEKAVDSAAEHYSQAVSVVNERMAEAEAALRAVNEALLKVKR